MSIPRFLVPDAGKGARLVTLARDEMHHLTRVLRLPVDAPVLVFDGTGRQWRGRVASVGRHEATVRLDEEAAAAAEPAVVVTLAIGLLKGVQMDAVVRDATMLGVGAIAPIVTDHVTVPERAWRSGAVLDRWRRVAIASARQCGRAVVPEIRPIASLPAVLSTSEAGMRLVCVEPARGVPARDLRDLARPAAATMFVGPEGGWSDGELEMAGRSGGVCVQLGPRTLRAEAVPTVLLSALWANWGW